MLTLYMPQKDLLGIISKKQQQEKRTQQNEEARTEIKKATARIKRDIERIQDPEIAEALNKLEQLPPDAKPQDVKRQAIRQLGDLSEQIKNMQKSADLASMKMMQQMLKQLRGSQDSFSQQLRLELAKGNFGKASSLLRQMQKGKQI